jgi:hypothetical protein
VDAVDPGSFGRYKLFPERVIKNDFLQKVGIRFLSCRGLTGVCGQPDGERGSLAVLAVGMDVPAVVVDDEVAGHQVDSVLHRAVAANHKRIEHQAQRFLRKARAIVADLDLNMLLLSRLARVSFGGELNAAAGRQAGDFVFQQQLKKPVHFRLINAQLRKRFGNLILDPDSFGLEPILELSGHFRHDRV